MHESLYERILDEPDDIEHRLVYADALQQRGDALGDFIALMAQSPDRWLRKSHFAFPESHGVVELAALWERHRGAWLGPILPYLNGMNTAQWWCGFLDIVKVDGAPLVRGADRVFSVAPIRTLGLTGRRVRIAPLAGAPGVRCVRKLVLTSGSLRLSPPEDLQVLHSAAFAGLRELDLSTNYVCDEGIEILVPALPPRRLRRLGLANNALSSAGVRMLAGSPGLGAIERLDLSDNDRIDDDGALALAESEHLGALEELSLTRSQVGPAGIAALRASARLPRLRQLDV